MILNLSKIKTESLLLFCKDLILSYKDKENSNIYNIDKDVIDTFNKVNDDMLKQISNVTFPSKYYLDNRKHYRIKAILDGYNFINNEISNALKKEEEFNPSMLYFSLLAVWFKELNKESKSKEYIYFTIFTYGKVYDEFLVNIKDENFKKINISMILLAEKIIYKFDKYSFK